jgi:hypothetical protein
MPRSLTVKRLKKGILDSDGVGCDILRPPKRTPMQVQFLAIDSRKRHPPVVRCTEPGSVPFEVDVHSSMIESVDTGIPECRYTAQNPAHSGRFD